MKKAWVISRNFLWGQFEILAVVTGKKTAERALKIIRSRIIDTEHEWEEIDTGSEIELSWQCDDLIITAKQFDVVSSGERLRKVIR